VWRRRRRISFIATSEWVAPLEQLSEQAPGCSFSGPPAGGGRGAGKPRAPGGTKKDSNGYSEHEQNIIILMLVME